MALSLEYDEAKLIAEYFAAHWRVGFMVDVGAQFGTSFRDYLRRDWRVLAFEPDALKFPQLARYESSPFLTLVKKAVGDRPSDGMPFFTSPESTGISSIVPFRDSHVPAGAVPVVTLTDELAIMGGRHVDYLKIDTEGYDLAVLCGFPWDRGRPEVILAEFDEIKTRRLGHTFRAIGDLIIRHGYDVYCSQWHPIVRYGGGYGWHSIVRYPCDLFHADAWGNFIAVRSDASTETMARLVGAHA